MFVPSSSLSLFFLELGFSFIFIDCVAWPHSFGAMTVPVYWFCDDFSSRLLLFVLSQSSNARIWALVKRYENRLFRFALVLWHINHSKLFNAKFFIYIYIYILNIYDWTWFGFIALNHCKLFNAKSSLYIYIYIYIYIYWIHVIWFGWVLWHVNHYKLFIAKSFSCIYTKYIGVALVGFYGISTIVGYLMQNPFHTYILNLYDLVWLVL